MVLDYTIVFYPSIVCVMIPLLRDCCLFKARRDQYSTRLREESMLSVPYNASVVEILRLLEFNFNLSYT